MKGKLYTVVCGDLLRGEDGRPGRNATNYADQQSRLANRQKWPFELIDDIPDLANQKQRFRSLGIETAARAGTRRSSIEVIFKFTKYRTVGSISRRDVGCRS